jgi:endonuclease YncB( thermonuclease family)
MAQSIRFLALVAPLLLPATAASAQARLPDDPGCRLERLGNGVVTQVLDGRSFALDDGRTIRLPGIEAPFPPSPGETGARAQAGSAAREALESILAGGEVELRARAPAAVDRYGRTLAHAYTARGRASAAHELLGRGFARVAADAECAAELLAREEAARAAKLGLWGNAYYAVIGAANLGALAAEYGHFTVVEGRILSVRESAGTIYLNFGRRSAEALTVTILKRNERTFVAAGLAAGRLTNLRVRVRGIVEERNGPRIEAARPEQIEIANR